MSLQLLLTTSCYSCPADPHFGFILNNLRFEIFNKKEGVVYNSGESDDVHGLMGMYDKKISGSSKNLNTFAAELKEVVVSYEKRLRDVAVTMTYIREERLVYVTVKGTVISTSEPYTYTSTISVWK
jgi:predicted component of type VI protein secretion system